VIGVAASDAPYDMKLSAVLANAPTIDKSERVGYRSQSVLLELPAPLLTWLNWKIVPNSGMDISQAVWSILMKEATSEQL